LALSLENKLDKTAGSIPAQSIFSDFMNILFVCKHNRFRSKAAEFFFNKFNSNPKLKAKSAGLIKGFLPLDKIEVNSAKTFGIELKGKTQGLSWNLMQWQDLIVIVADDVPKEIFEQYKKQGLIQWKIKDNSENTKEKAKQVLQEIKEKIQSLLLSKPL
jgi:arsenate reductase (thioredoxin)